MELPGLSRHFAEHVSLRRTKPIGDDQSVAAFQGRVEIPILEGTIFLGLTWCRLGLVFELPSGILFGWILQGVTP
jgi:hypothetical protein